MCKRGAEGHIERSECLQNISLNCMMKGIYSRIFSCPSDSRNYMLYTVLFPLFLDNLNTLRIVPGCLLYGHLLSYNEEFILQTIFKWDI